MRTKVFFCGACKSVQKASVENMNKQLRKFYPKGSSINQYKQEDVWQVVKTINETCLLSLDGKTPKEAFITIFGSETYSKLF